MNVLINQASINSQQIADMLGSRHDKVKQSIARLSSDNDRRFAVIASPPMGVVQVMANNRLYDTDVYIFSGEQGKRDSIVVVAQLSPEFTAVLVDRWQELEGGIAITQPTTPQSFAEALQLAADQAKQLELAAPKINHYNTVVERSTLLNATQVGQKISLSARKLNGILDELGVYNKSVRRSRIFQQWFIDDGLGETKQTGLGFSQALFSLKGEAWIIETLTSEGII